VASFGCRVLGNEVWGEVKIKIAQTEMALGIV
jgi:hypothetical protein